MANTAKWYSTPAVLATCSDGSAQKSKKVLQCCTVPTGRWLLSCMSNVRAHVSTFYRLALAAIPKESNHCGPEQREPLRHYSESHP